MLDLLDRTFLLHLLLNTTYIGLGVVLGLLLAWKVGLERRYVVRAPFLRRVLLLTLALAVLITLLARDSIHFVAGTVGGLVAGFAVAYLSRVQAKPKAGQGGTSGQPG